MILKDHHKEFAIKAYAQFMTRKQVAAAFIQEFPNDLPKPPQLAQSENAEAARKAYEDEKQQYVNEFLQGELYLTYKEEHGENADEQWEKDRPTLIEQLDKEYERAFPYDAEAQQKQQMYEYQEQLKEHYKQLKIDLSNQLRRYNIIHPKFPKKYRNLFNKFRQEHYQNCYHTQTDQTAETLNKELNTLYGLAKEQAFYNQGSKDCPKHLEIAHNLLKTIVA